MPESKHTPGPWTAHTDVVGTNPDILVDAIGHGIIADIGGGSIEERQANANLIAAAPELLAALKEYVATIPAFRSKPVGAPGSAARNEQGALIALEDRAKAVIAKAEGR